MSDVKARFAERRRCLRVAVRSPFLVFQKEQLIGHGLTLNLGKGGALLELSATETPLGSPQPLQVEIALPRGRYTSPHSLHCKAIVTRTSSLNDKLVIAVEFLGVATGLSSAAIDAFAPFISEREKIRYGAVI